MDTPDGGLLCQGCWDLLNRLDVCVHSGINRAASLEPARQGWWMHWERNWDGGKDPQQWAREGGVWARRRLPGCISSCSMAGVLQSHLQRADTLGASRAAAGSSCAEVGEAALHSPRTAWAVVGLCCSSQNFSLNKPNLSNLKAAGIHQPSQRQCVPGPSGTLAWGFILQEPSVPNWVKILGSLLHKASLMCFWGCLKQGQGSLWNNSTYPAAPVCDG